MTKATQSITSRLENDDRFSRWTKYGKDRFYIDTEDVHDIIGISIQRYNTGNISSARVREDSAVAYHLGEDLSNNAARKAQIWGKLWYDVDAKAWKSKGMASWVVDAVRESISG